jgi:hypothetical protein
MTCNSIYPPLEVNELELYIQALISATTHTQKINQLIRIKNGAIKLGIKNTHHFGSFKMYQKELLNAFGWKLKPEHQKFIDMCFYLDRKGNNLDNKGGSDFYMTPLFRRYINNILKRDLNNIIEGNNISYTNKVQTGDLMITLSIPNDTLKNAARQVLTTKRIHNWRSVLELVSYSTNNHIANEFDLIVPYNTDDHSRAHGELTRMSKEVRRLCFSGWYDIDINTAAPSLLSQYAKNEFNIDMPFVQQYIDNKTTIRQQFAKDLDISIKQIKDLFTALFFGMSSNKINNHFVSAMEKILGQDAMREIQCNKFWNDLVNEIKETTKIFITEIKKQHDGAIINLQGKELIGSRNKPRTKGRVLSHTYNGLERMISDIILDYTGTNDVFPIYDGFLSKSDVDISALEKHIEMSTGYKLTFSKEQIL